MGAVFSTLTYLPTYPLHHIHIASARPLSTSTWAVDLHLLQPPREPAVPALADGTPASHASPTLPCTLKRGPEGWRGHTPRSPVGSRAPSRVKSEARRPRSELSRALEPWSLNVSGIGNDLRQLYRLPLAGTWLVWSPGPGPGSLGQRPSYLASYRSTLLPRLHARPNQT